MLCGYFLIVLTDFTLKYSNSSRLTEKFVRDVKNYSYIDGFFEIKVTIFDLRDLIVGIKNEEKKV